MNETGGIHIMRYEKVRFDDTDQDAFLETYVADPIEGFVRNAVLVIPGGGYGIVCADREGEPIAQAFMPYGYNAFVLHYSVGKKPFPAHLVQASKAMQHIKDNAELYNIDPDRVFVVGFSAGAHLAASLGTMWHKEENYSETNMPYGYNKPAGMMLIYPVISAKYHTMSFENLLMEKPAAEDKLQMCSIENWVSDQSAPAYILHTANDEIVDVRNSLTLANALATKGIKFEMHIYPDAPHGVALGNEITQCGVEKWCNPSIAKWVPNAVEWAKNV